MEKRVKTVYQMGKFFCTPNKVLLIKPGIIQYSTLNFSTKTINSTCWKCGVKRSNISDVFCNKCHTIQAPTETNNYFKIFSIQEGFNVDQALLKDKFRKFQTLIHPDKFSNRTHEEQTISEEFSSLINKAYTNLMSPMKRAEHLLHLQGESITEGQVIDDPKFLMQIMMLNEEVDDAGEDILKLKQLNEKNQLELKKLGNEVDKHFRNQNIDAAKKTIIKLKYFTSIDNRINSLFREAGSTD